MVKQIDYYVLQTIFTMLLYKAYLLPIINLIGVYDINTGRIKKKGGPRLLNLLSSFISHF